LSTTIDVSWAKTNAFQLILAYMFRTTPE